MSANYDHWRDAARSATTDVSRILRQAFSLTHYFGNIDLWRVLLTLVSAATTWFGMSLLYDVFGTDHGAGSIGWLRFVIPVAMAGAIHAAIFWALRQWVQTLAA